MRSFLLRNEGVPSFCLCTSLFLCVGQKVERRASEGRKEGVHHLLKESFLRLRSFGALISFVACELRGDVELFWHSSFDVIDAPALVMRSCV